MIDFDKFVDWAESRFGEVVIKGDEVKVNSIFQDDTKHKMWCNPYGGKTGVKSGVYHCWKSGESGTLIELVMKVDNCSYEEAFETLGGSQTTSFRELEQKMVEFFNNIQKQKLRKKEEPESELKLPLNTFYISKLPKDDFYRMEAELQLTTRKIPIDNLMVCTEGDYRNRIVIPYRDENNELIYFNSRLLWDHKKLPKYLGPKKECGVGKGDVVFMPQWPSTGTRIYLTEGEFDAMSLNIAGFYGCAVGGKEITENQMGLISKYSVTIGLDNDEAGFDALIKIGDSLLEKGFQNTKYISPPTKYKDWNEMLEDLSPQLIKKYIERYERSYDEFSKINLQLMNL
jgi:DNA primase